MEKPCPADYTAMVVFASHGKTESERSPSHFLIEKLTPLLWLRHMKICPPYLLLCLKSIRTKVIECKNKNVLFCKGHLQT